MIKKLLLAIAIIIGTQPIHAMRQAQQAVVQNASKSCLQQIQQMFVKSGLQATAQRMIAKYPRMTCIAGVYAGLFIEGTISSTIFFNRIRDHTTTAKSLQDSYSIKVDQIYHDPLKKIQAILLEAEQSQDKKDTANQCVAHLKVCIDAEKLSDRLAAYRDYIIVPARLTLFVIGLYKLYYHGLVYYKNWLLPKYRYLFCAQAVGGLYAYCGSRKLLGKAPFGQLAPSSRSEKEILTDGKIKAQRFLDMNYVERNKL